MNLCGVIDGARFEDPQDQGFADAPEQQCFEEGKWSLIIFWSQ
jgi:hypothetical protein